MLLVALCIILLLLGAAGTGGYLWLARSLPVIKGQLTVPGLTAQVFVYRDAMGVPHIEASNEQDLFMAQGYVTAQDRLFQMDLSRRQASGELSEIIGSKTLDRDKFFRTFGLRRAAEASLKTYSAESQAYLNAYAKGVNDYMQEAEASGKLPVEFQLLGYQPKPWTALDSLTIGKYMAFDLGGHWDGEAFRYYLLEHFPKDKALDLFPSYPDNAPTIIKTAMAHPLDLSKSFASAVIPNEYNGSNNWVVSGDKTASGKPLLANDPHLALAAPSIWYEAHLKSPQYDVSGVVFAGVPGIIVGHNEQIAWGVTNVGPDVQDLYIEKRNPANPNEFQYMGKWEQAQVITENIQVKGSPVVPYQVTITRHGPIISEFAHNEHPDTALALKWTALDPSHELEAVLGFDKSKNWNDFKTALEQFDTPAQNFVFASQDGTIAYRANGRIPIRKKGDGSTPVPGWTDEYEWQGYIPWDQLPTVVNPKQGFIATANNKVVDAGYPYHITDAWAQPYREERIVQVLASKSKLTAEDLQKLQFDHKDLQAEELLPLLLAALDQDIPANSLRSQDQAAIKLLKSWDDQEEPSQAAPLLFELWMQDSPDFLFKDQIDSSMYALFDGREQVVDQLIRRAASGHPGPWIQEKGGLAQVALKSLQHAVDQGIKLQGDQLDHWKWGQFHKISFSHPLSAVKPLNLLFDPEPVPMGGSRVTVGAAGYNASTGDVNHGAAWRTVVDLSDLNRSFDVVGPGQSGQVLSHWYHDQIGDWTTGHYHVTSMNPSEYQKTGNRLILTP